MEFEEIIKQKLTARGFTQKQLLNNRGLIGAIIDETILLQTKNLILFGVVRQSEQLKEKQKISFEEWLKVNYLEQEYIFLTSRGLTDSADKLYRKYELEFNPNL